MPAATKSPAKSSEYSIKTKTPAQHAQPSRKGKKAWRKNIDIGEVEEGLEEIRQEERVTGSALQTKKNTELFQIDTVGDAKVRKSLQKFDSSQLTSSKILAQRSAVPAVLSRPITSSSSAPKKSKHSVSREDKIRLLRMAKRKVRGPLNTVVDTTVIGAGSAMLDPSHAVEMSGKYDIWTHGDEENVDEDEDMIPETSRKRKPKAPQVPHPRSAIPIPAIPEPHQGTSYNPPASAHLELLKAAHEKEQRREDEKQKFEGLKESMLKAWEGVEPTPDDVAVGMTVDINEPGEEDEAEADGDETSAAAAKKAAKKKSKQQRQTALKLKSERHALRERIEKKRMLASINSVRSMRAFVRKSMAANDQAGAGAKKLAALEKRMKDIGLAGLRLGKHHIPEDEVEVQLGEDLSESLRGLKPEGNLFRDRFQSMQKRALVEPRKPVLARPERKASWKWVEKFAWKQHMEHLAE